MRIVQIESETNKVERRKQMLRPLYLKEGPGIPKNAPEKPYVTTILETFVREFWQLIKLNFLFLVCCLPIVTFGAARAALSRCAVNMVRDIPNDVWSDFRDALHDQTRRHITAGLIELGLLLLGLYTMHLGAITEMQFLTILGIIIIILSAFYFQYFWLISANLDLKADKTIKNALLIGLLRPLHTTACILIDMAVFLPCIFFFPFTIPVILTLPFGVSGFFNSAVGWSICKKYLIK